jgi:acetyltransferase-like isoleucine patch superfamily enzyme
MQIFKNRLPISQIIFVGLLPSYLKLIVYRIKGYSIGKNVHIGLGSVVIGKEVHIKANTKIGFFSMLRAKEIQLDKYVSIGSFCFIEAYEIKIGEDTKIKEQVKVGGTIGFDSKLIFGKRCVVFQNTMLNPTSAIEVGDDSGIGGNCQLFTHGSWLSVLDGFPVTHGSIKIGNNVWIPWNVFILPNVTIGNNVVIRASSLVTRNIPSNCIAGGNPAKILIKKFPVTPTDEDRLNKYMAIHQEYIRQLESLGFAVNIVLDDKNKKTYNLSKGRKKHIIYIYFDASPIIEKMHPKIDSLVILYSNNIKSEQSKLNNKAIQCISIEKKERYKSSEIGENYCKFLSRYGIRFNRIDDCIR